MLSSAGFGLNRQILTAAYLADLSYYEKGVAFNEFALLFSIDRVRIGGRIRSHSN
jgi:hypothetical protein